MAAPAKVITLVDIRTAEVDFNRDRIAQGRVDELTRRLTPHEDKLKKLAAQAARAKCMTAKFALLRELVWHVENALIGLTPCQDKCSHCCNMPVVISQAEADLIGKQIGRTPKRVQYRREANDSYIGQPCPFLKNDRCSIYSARPFECRTHYSAEPDNVPCHLVPGEKITVRYFNMNQFDNLLWTALGPAELEKTADIREFFPEQGRAKE